MITPELRNIQSLFPSDCLENHILELNSINYLKMNSLMKLINIVEIYLSN